jgi:hypothetical protein
MANTIVRTIPHLRSRTANKDTALIQFTLRDSVSNRNLCFDYEREEWVPACLKASFCTADDLRSLELPPMAKQTFVMHNFRGTALQKRAIRILRSRGLQQFRHVDLETDTFIYIARRELVGRRE